MTWSTRGQLLFLACQLVGFLLGLAAGLLVAYLFTAGELGGALVALTFALAGVMAGSAVGVELEGRHERSRLGLPAREH